MKDSISSLRNIAIVAHVDHGKTTLVDELLRQSGTLESHGAVQERVMDSNELERERGITILSKNTAIRWQDWRINIVDTPGHADFGGEVERVLSMVDSVLLLVDAVEGPMPQTRFVTQKALEHGLAPIVVVNKIDRPGSRPDWVVDQTFELFDRLGASDSQLDFPVVYASALQGWSTLESDAIASDMQPLFQAIVDNVAPPLVDPEGSFQLQVSALDYSTYVGVIGIGRIQRGRFSRNDVVCVAGTDGSVREERILQVLGFNGLDRIELDAASAGDIVAFTGVDGLRISDTLCDPSCIDPLPALKVDEPTLSMTFQVNDSPFAGQDGKFVTSRNLGERLARELIHNVALRVESLSDPDKFKVSGRGELHLSILVENMRREGHELAISRPEVILREVDGVVHEPWETLTVDVESVDQGRVMERLGERRAELRDILPDSNGRVRLDYTVPSRGLIGFRSEFMTITRGLGLMYHTFERYADRAQSKIGERVNGVLVSITEGKSLAYALFNLQERGRLFIGPAERVYEGMVIGIHSRSSDLVVNPLKAKQLTNIRAAGSDENILLTPPVELTLEAAIEFINNDELVEVTPTAIRVRKKLLREHERKRAARAA
ncbi:MAG: translational GTPase TypA [Arenicellales bacterium]|jgi:GTP-binding protein|nr:translational GTPase TypA [Arenicellales bacterium]MDP7517561.1 translational GTPase TypA [Arenicellales bacterium]MDP7617870.1 translational GTPase TypA [Arenicellales bacterium]